MFRDINHFTGEALGILSIALLIALIIFIFFLLTLQNCLKNISPENRKMPPANVWLMFIPVFNWFFQFNMVSKISDSLAAEFQKRGITGEEARPGYNIGLAFCICNIVGNLLSRNVNTLEISTLAGIGALVCLIIYWVKISNYSKQLGSSDGNDNILDRNI